LHQLDEFLNTVRRWRRVVVRKHDMIRRGKEIKYWRSRFYV
jgi:hypothetical protein